MSTGISTEDRRCSGWLSGFLCKGITAAMGVNAIPLYSSCALAGAPSTMAESTNYRCISRYLNYRDYGAFSRTSVECLCCGAGNQRENGRGPGGEAESFAG